MAAMTDGEGDEKALRFYTACFDGNLDEVQRIVQEVWAAPTSAPDYKDEVQMMRVRLAQKELEKKSIEDLDALIAFQTTDVQLMSKVYNSEYQGKNSDLLRKEEALGQAYQDLVIPARAQLALMKEILEVKSERSAAI